VAIWDQTSSIPTLLGSLQPAHGRGLEQIDLYVYSERKI
jgi:hypothetical protein